MKPLGQGKHVNNEGARIKGQFNDRVQAEEMDFTGKDEEEALPPSPVKRDPHKQYFPGVVDNQGAKIKGQFNAPVTAKKMQF